MKGKSMIALMIVALAGTPGLAVSGDTAGTHPDKEAPVADSKAAAPEDAKVNDKEVAVRMEMLQFMDMLEHYDLIKDLDVIQGGGEQK